MKTSENPRNSGIEDPHNIDCEICGEYLGIKDYEFKTDVKCPHCKRNNSGKWFKCKSCEDLFLKQKEDSSESLCKECTVIINSCTFLKIQGDDNVKS